MTIEDCANCYPIPAVNVVIDMIKRERLMAGVGAQPTRVRSHARRVAGAPIESNSGIKPTVVARRPRLRESISWYVFIKTKRTLAGGDCEGKSRQRFWYPIVPLQAPYFMWAAQMRL